MFTKTAAALTALLFALPLPAARAASAAGRHSVVVRVSNGRTLYTQTLPITENSQSSHVGPVNASNGGPRMEMIFNGLLTRARDAAAPLILQYQVELTGGAGSQGRSIQGQGEAAMRPEKDITVIECGPWTVELVLDAKKGAKKKAGNTAWDPAGLPNYRLTADVTAGGSKQRCALVSRAGSQSNVADSISQGGRKYGFILNGLFTPAEGGRSFTLQYQIEHGLNAASRPFQMQNEEELTLNRKKTLTGQGYRLNLLLEGRSAPAGQPAPGEGGKGGSEDEYGTVQPLR